MGALPTESPNMDVKVGSHEMALLSNILAAYTFVADQPERTVLVFLASVCFGLFVTLCAVVVQIHCRTDCRYGNSHRPRHHRGNRLRHKHYHHRSCPRHQHGSSNPDNMAVVLAGGEGPSGDGESEDGDETSHLSARRQRHLERGQLHTSGFASADEFNRALRLEQRERILSEIWMNGHPDISTVTQSLNRYY